MKKKKFYPQINLPGNKHFLVNGRQHEAISELLDAICVALELSDGGGLEQGWGQHWILRIPKKANNKDELTIRLYLSNRNILKSISVWDGNQMIYDSQVDISYHAKALEVAMEAM